MWQCLEPLDSLTLLTVNYGPEILGGEDADGLMQGTGTEFSSNLAVPGNSSDIQGVLQVLGPIKTGMNINRDPAQAKR